MVASSGLVQNPMEEDVAGLDLRGAVIGSEGMFGVVTRTG